MGQLDDAVTAHAAARDAIPDAELAAAELVAEARRAERTAREALWAAIVQATEQGMQQSEIVRRTGLARESVRRILRRAGVEAD